MRIAVSLRLSHIKPLLCTEMCVNMNTEHPHLLMTNCCSDTEMTTAPCAVLLLFPFIFTVYTLENKGFYWRGWFHEEHIHSINGTLDYENVLYTIDSSSLRNPDLLWNCCKTKCSDVMNCIFRGIV